MAVILSSPIPAHFLNPNPNSVVSLPTKIPNSKPRISLKIQRRRSSVTFQLKDDAEPKNPQDGEVDNLGVKAALSMLKFYKREISPLMPKSCRYIPTCSEYSMDAYKKYGVVKGSILTAWRLCRCNPFGGSGFDPPRWFGEESPAEE